MIEDTLGGRDQGGGGCLPVRFAGVLTARVIDVDDPLMLGRVRVQLPAIDALDLQPWARIAQAMAGLTHGQYFTPNVGDEVLVGFEQGDLNAPYILGSLWTALARPPLASPRPQVRAIRTLSGNQVVLEEMSPAITLQTAPTPPESLPTPGSPVGPHQTLRLSPQGIQAQGSTIELTAGNATLRLAPGLISIEVGNSTIRVTDAAIQISAAAISVGATGALQQRGNPILLNS